MCLIAFAIRSSARWPLVVAANRDEYLNRPSAPLARWRTPGGADIVSGRDLRAGGAWFGVTPQGRVAFLTNVRELHAPDAPRSRGELVTGWLESAIDADDFAATLRADEADFAGFNLVIGDYQSNAWHWVTNRAVHSSSRQGLQVQALPAGVYGLSNAALDTPWPKTLDLKKALADALQLRGEPAPRAALEGVLWEALASGERPAAELMPRTGLPLAREQALSSAFVDFSDGAYGTVSSTLLTVEAPGLAHGQTGIGKVSIQERQHRRGPGAAALKPAPAWVLNSETLAWPAGASAP